MEREAQYEALVKIQSKVRQIQATLQYRNAKITLSKQQGSSQAIMPAQACKTSKKISEQSKQGKSLQSERNEQGKSLQSEQSENVSSAELHGANGHKINDKFPKVSAKQGETKPAPSTLPQSLKRRMNLQQRPVEKKFQQEQISWANQRKKSQAY